MIILHFYLRKEQARGRSGKEAENEKGIGGRRAVESRGEGGGERREGGGEKGGGREGRGGGTKAQNYNGMTCTEPSLAPIRSALISECRHTQTTPSLKTLSCLCRAPVSAL
mmetsp:Transcript_23767/g.59996  ORF Transcript_23767/g.59996 Transcript_23767/m.59996 type:complete len:111 (+) Transcript_23767:107-439(+)